MREAQRLLQCIENDEPLPDVKGARRLPPSDAPKNFADTIPLCYKFLDNIRYRIDPITYKGYKSRIRVLHRWLSDTGRNGLPVGRFTVHLVKEFLRWLKENNYSNQSHNSYRSSLGRIWTEIKSEGIVSSNPWKEVTALPRMSIPFRAMTETIERIIVKELPHYDHQLWLVAQFIYYDFVRVCECTRLKLWMLNWQEQTLTLPADVSRKGKRERTVVIPDVLFQQLLALEYDEMDPEHFIFSENGRPGAKRLAYNNLNKRFRRFREHFRIPVVYKLYGMKHTGNSRLARSGVNAQLQKLHNGHASLEYTQRYLSGLSISDTNFLKKDFPKLGG